MIFVCFLVVLLVSCLKTNNDAEAVYKYDNYLETPPSIRVLLHNDIKEIQIEINQPFSISDFKSNEILADKVSLKKSVMYLNSGDFRTRPLTSDSTYNTPTAFVKANGSTSDKVFQISEFSLKANTAKTFKRKQWFKELSTRKHYHGKHTITLIINGDKKESIRLMLKK